MSYLLDTNSVIAILKGRPASVRSTLDRHLRNDVAVFVSSIVMFELWYGVAKSTRQDENAERLRTFENGRIELLSFELDDARIAGDIRNRLRALGTPIDPYDLLIAGQALRHRATLVTSNIAEFRRVEGVALEDWAAPDVR